MQSSESSASTYHTTDDCYDGRMFVENRRREQKRDTRAVPWYHPDDMHSVKKDTEVT
jgi:hypothetical protein